MKLADDDDGDEVLESLWKNNSWLIELHVTHGSLGGELERRWSNFPVNRALRGAKKFLSIAQKKREQS